MISTGALVRPHDPPVTGVVRGAVVGGSGAARTNEFLSRVLFDHTSGSVYSVVTALKPGDVLCASVYEILPGQTITIEKVVLPYAEPPYRSSQDSCGDGNVPASYLPAVLFSRPVKTNGVVWQLSDNTDMVYVTVPGNYRFVLSDESMIGHVYLEALVYKSDHVQARLLAGLTA